MMDTDLFDANGRPSGPDALGERLPTGEGLLRLRPPALAALLERGVHPRPGGFARVFFQPETGVLGFKLDRDGDFRLRGRLDHGLWTRSPLLSRERFREGPYRLAFPPGVDFALVPVPAEEPTLAAAPLPADPAFPRAGQPRDRRRRSAHAVLAVPRVGAPQLRTTAAGLDFLARRRVALAPGDRVAVRHEPATGRLALAADPNGSFSLRRAPGAGQGFTLAATALARLVGGPAAYAFTLAPDGALLLTPILPGASGPSPVFADTSPRSG